MSLKTCTLEEMPDNWRKAWFGATDPGPDYQGQLYTSYDEYQSPAYVVVERQVTIGPGETDGGGAAMLPPGFIVTGGGYFVAEGSRGYTVTTSTVGGPENAPYSAWLVNLQLEAGDTEFLYVIRAIGLLKGPS